MLLFLDIETTGFDTKKDNIIEISAIRFDGEKEVKRFDTLVSLPEGSVISPFISALTGITGEMCEKKGKSLEEVREEFQKFLLSDDIITGHNISFDTGFLKEFGFQIPNKEIDTFFLSSMLLFEEESHSLEVLTQKYELEHTSAHRALSDVIANIEVWKFLQKKFQNFCTKELWENLENILEKTDTPEKEFFLSAAKGQVFRPESQKPKPFFFHTLPEKEGKKNEILPGQQDLFDHIEEKKRKEKDEFFNILFHLKESDILFWEEKNQRKIKEILPEILKQEISCVSIVYPDSSQKEFFTFFQQYFSSIAQFFLPQERTVSYEKFLSLFQKPSFSRWEISVILKVFFAIEQEKIEKINFLGEEWSTARSILGGEKKQFFSEKNIQFVPFSESYNLPKNTLSLFFGADELEDMMTDILQKKVFSKRLKENFLLFEEEHEKQEIFTNITFLFTKFSKFLRKEVGESEYPKNIPFDQDLLQKEEMQGILHEFLNLFEEERIPKSLSSSLQQDLKDIYTFFFASANSNILQNIQLFSDDEFSLTKTHINLSEDFLQLCEGRKNVFFGNAFAKDKEWKKVIFPFSLPKNSKYYFSEIKEEYFLENTLFIPQKTQKEDTKILIDCAKKLVKKGYSPILSVSSQKVASGIIEEIFEYAQKNNIALFSHQNGSVGKIRAMIPLSQKKILIATPKLLDNLHPENFDFNALLILKFSFDPKGNPLISERRKFFDYDFEGFAMPRAIARFEKEVYRLYGTKKDVFVFVADPRIADKSLFTAQFANILPLETKIKEWE